MGFRCGIVGLPNVGKSTIFNAITASNQAAAANYPFCTIEPNVGMVPVPDQRLDRLVELVSPAKVQPAAIQFVDIAGLVKGASAGEGLGNKFLSHIRDVDAIAHIVRCFENDDIVHVDGSVDPARDIEVIETELVLKDLETVESRYQKVEKLSRSADKTAKVHIEFLKRLREWLDQGRWARAMEVADTEREWFEELHLLSSKPVLYVANVGEEDLPRGNGHSETVRKIAEERRSGFVLISGRIEAEIAQLPREERAAFLEGVGLERSGLDELIRAGYALLGLRTYFTAGPKEVRAWTIHAGDTAPAAAGKIHTDFQRGFICAETIAFADYDRCGGEQKSKEAGKMRTEGKEYVVADGDVMLFRFNV